MTSELDDDSALPPHLIALFVRTAPAQMSDLSAACRRYDSEGGRALAHKLKGGLYAAGASQLAETMEHLRGLLTHARWVELEQQLPEIEARFTRMIDELRVRASGGGS